MKKRYIFSLILVACMVFCYIYNSISLFSASWDSEDSAITLLSFICSFGLCILLFASVFIIDIKHLKFVRFYLNFIFFGTIIIYIGGQIALIICSQICEDVFFNLLGILFFLIKFIFIVPFYGLFRYSEYDYILILVFIFILNYALMCRIKKYSDNIESSVQTPDD